MGIDIRWFGLIEKYLIDGDIGEIEALIREGGVPIEFGNQIADILTKKLQSPTPAKSAILKRIEKYKSGLCAMKTARKKGSIYEVAYRELNIGKDPKKTYTMQLLAQWMYPKYDAENARTQLRQFRIKYELPKL